MQNRRGDWRSRLHRFLIECEKTPFEYGTHDCALFGAGAVEAVTGNDPAEDFRGTYKTKLGGIRKIKKAGYESQIDFIEQNFKEVPRSFGKAGDLALVETDEGPAIAVVAGPFAAALSEEQGLIRIPFNQIERVFRV